MPFNSFSFAIFLPLVFAAYWALPHRYRWPFLLAASCYFYMSFHPAYIVLLGMTALVTYAAAIYIEKTADQKIRRMILIAALFYCLGVLFFFKYFNFFMDTAAKTASLFSLQLSPITLRLILPAGISFYTFLAIGYVTDVYRGDISAEKHFGKYALFISFFPSLTSGPIERGGHLLPQLNEEHTFDYDLAAYGLKQMAWGFFKKTVIADTIAGYASAVIDNPYPYHGFTLVLAITLYAIQIYCDFSGYSDIAIGTAKLLGIRLMTNFSSPYFSQTIKELWSRWHISLSSWFRDYVYIPLGGNRVSKPRQWFNLLVTFLASGLWHGASFTYVIWGLIHGLGQVLESILIPKQHRTSKGLIRVLRTLFVFGFFLLALVFFASKTVPDALYFLRHIPQGIRRPASYFADGWEDLGFQGDDAVWLGISLFLLTVFDFISLKQDVFELIAKQKTVIRWAVYIVFLCWMILNIPVFTTTQFIYFQF